MDIRINEGFKLSIYGFSGVAVNKDYVRTAFQLSDAMWRVVKELGLSHKGKNIWVYEPGEKVFAGVELENVPDQNTSLEQKGIHLSKYAYFKHIGPYNMIKQSGERMSDQLRSRGFRIEGPYIEIYGHWDSDETKLETELLMSLK